MDAVRGVRGRTGSAVGSFEVISSSIRFRGGRRAVMESGIRTGFVRRPVEDFATVRGAATQGVRGRSETPRRAFGIRLFMTSQVGTPLVASGTSTQYAPTAAATVTAASGVNPSSARKPAMVQSPDPVVPATSTK